MSDPTTDVIPADAIQAIKTLPHITVDRMLGLWVSLDQVVGLLNGWRQPPEARASSDAALVALREALDELVNAWDSGRTERMDEALLDADRVLTDTAAAAEEAVARIEKAAFARYGFVEVEHPKGNFALMLERDAERLLAPREPTK